MPFPGYEKTVPASGPSTERNHYVLAGQIVAIRKKDGTTNTLYHVLTDQLGINP